MLASYRLQFDPKGDSRDRRLCSRKQPPRIRAKLTSEWLPQAWHSVPRLLLMASQSRQKTAVPSGTTSGWGSFHVAAETCFRFELISLTSATGEAPHTAARTALGGPDLRGVMLWNERDHGRQL